MNCNFIVDAKEEGLKGLDQTKIECTKCKYVFILSWKEKKLEQPCFSKCEKYNCKPDGILYPETKSPTDRPGTYIKCPYFEAKAQGDIEK